MNIVHTTCVCTFVFIAAIMEAFAELIRLFYDIVPRFWC